MTPSVRVRGLTKSYGAFQAVKGIDFEIFPGEVFWLLGPNGAGKRPSPVEILEGMRPRNISATERISMVVLKGERVRRVDLFDAARIRCGDGWRLVNWAMGKLVNYQLTHLPTYLLR